MFTFSKLLFIVCYVLGLVFVSAQAAQYSDYNAVYVKCSHRGV